MAYQIQGDLNVSRNISSRNLTLSEPNSLTMSGSTLNVTGASTINQNVTTTGSPTFNSVTLTGPIIADLQAVTKQYADSIAAGIQSHASVDVATTTTLTLGVDYTRSGSGSAHILTSTSSGVISFDGYYELFDDIDHNGASANPNDLYPACRVLFKDASDQKDNGVYAIKNSGGISTPWQLIRASDFDGSPANEVRGGDLVFVSYGNTNAYTQWSISSPTKNAIVDYDNIVWTQFAAAVVYTASNGVKKVINDFQLDISGLPLNTIATNDSLGYFDASTGLNSKTAVSSFLSDLNIVHNITSNGIIVRTAADTYVERTITGTSNYIDVTNGDGVAGNPTITISPTYSGQTSITNLGTIVAGTWNGSTIGVPYGGTGLSTTPTNGQLLIGNGTNYTLSTLTAGSGIYINNGAGSITINASGTAYLAGSGLILDGTTFNVDLTNNPNGILPVNHGGTGLSTIGQNAVMYGNGTSAVQYISGSPNKVFYSNAGVPSFSSKLELVDTYPILQATAGNTFYVQTISGSLQVNAVGTGSHSLNLITTKSAVGEDSPFININTGGGGAINTGNIQIGTGVPTGGTAGVITFSIGGPTIATIDSTGLSLSVNKYISINSNNVLSETTLGSTVLYSSLKTVGTISGGVWQGSIIGNAYGGTGLNTSTASNGQLLIGNGSGFSLSTLTQGSGITITNGPGTITLAVDFTTSVVGGSGITQTGNQLDIVSTNGAISVGTNDITFVADTVGGANLARAINVSTNGVAVKVDASTINEDTGNSNRLYVPNQGITETQLNTSVAGNGLTGGGGTPLAVGAGNGISVGSDTVSVSAGSGIVVDSNVNANVDNKTIQIVTNQISLKKYTINIDVADWSAPSGGYSVYSISAATHGYSNFGTVKTYAAYSGTVALTTHTGADNYLEFEPDRIKYDAVTNAIELRVVNDGVTDARYAARIIIG